ncbi:MAG: insulinase family protein, partial [Bacillota bacterium]
APHHGFLDPVVVTEPRLKALPTGHPRVDLLVGYLGVPFSSSSRNAMELLADILGGGIRSRLFLELREKRKMAYLVHAYPVTYGLGGYLAIRVNCDLSELPKVYAAIQQQLEYVKEDGICSSELTRAKAARTTAILRVLENSSQHLQLLGRHSVLNDEFFVDLETRRVEAVQTEDIVRVARDILVPDNLAVVALGPKEENLLQLV